ncbi:hypothetical protein EDB80DRAFT_781502 [Ilyonectria destructans]|nr:hypothetical protein EDB80DRAFT_781502 [Ilyonectria destructans]
MARLGAWLMGWMVDGRWLNSGCANHGGVELRLACQRVTLSPSAQGRRARYPQVPKVHGRPLVGSPVAAASSGRLVDGAGGWWGAGALGGAGFSPFSLAQGCDREGHSGGGCPVSPVRCVLCVAPLRAPGARASTVGPWE